MTAEHRTDATTARARGWLWWLVVNLVVAGLAFLGGWLIGLGPAYTAALVGVVALGSLAWTAVDRRRRDDVGSPVGASVRVLVTGVVLLVAIQALPIGRDHSNPPVTGEPAWSSPQTRELMVSACFSCHSNEVQWPWYANVAPMSWAVADHVEEGREAVNFSEFATNRGEAEESIEVILDGEMPPTYYTRFGLHGEANLSPAEIDELVAGLRATPGFGEEDEREDEDREDEREDEREDDEREDD